MSEWFVYILRCADYTLYTGITTDLIRRCKLHNAGTAPLYTRSLLPVVFGLPGSTAQSQPRSQKGVGIQGPYHVSKKSC